MDVIETAQRHANDVVSQNQAALMGDFTPNGFSKAMTTLAANPPVATAAEVNLVADDEVEITYQTSTGPRVIWSKWVQTGDKWQIDDLAERSSKADDLVENNGS